MFSMRMWLLVSVVLVAGVVGVGEAAAGRPRPCPDRGHPSFHGRALGVPDHACRPPTTIRMTTSLARGDARAVERLVKLKHAMRTM